MAIAIDLFKGLNLRSVYYIIEQYRTILKQYIARPLRLPLVYKLYRNLYLIDRSKAL